MNPTRITRRLARILAAQSGALLASTITTPDALATGLEQARSCPAPRGLHAALISGACPAGRSP